jgi:hypothetical protein
MGNCCSLCFGSKSKTEEAQYKPVSSNEPGSSSSQAPSSVAMAGLSSRGGGNGAGAGQDDTAGHTDVEAGTDHSEWENFEDSDEDESAKQQHALTKPSGNSNAPRLSPTAAAIITPLPAPPAQMSPVPTIAPPPNAHWPASNLSPAAAAAPVPAPAPAPAEVDLFAAIGMEPYIEPARVQPKRPLGGAATSGNATNGRSFGNGGRAATTAPPAQVASSNKFSLERLMATSSGGDADVSGWGDDVPSVSGASGNSSKLRSPLVDSVHDAADADLDIQIESDLRALGIEVDGDEEATAAAAASTKHPARTAIKPTPGMKKGAGAGGKKAGGGSAPKKSLLLASTEVEPMPEDDGADIEIDLDAI